MAWTPWRKIADKAYWYTHHSLRLPVCYELAVAKPGDPESLEIVYVGAAASEHHELPAYERGERPISPRIQEELARNQLIFYRCQGAPDLEAANSLKRERMAAQDYPWNEEGAPEQDA